jgi:hypothetical protein
VKRLFHHEHPFRIFAISSLITLGGIFGVLFGMGTKSAVIILILIAVEIAFSFDNAIINAKTLAKLSDFWQKMFLTVGMIIAVLGMRVVFPILIVSLTAHLPWGTVLDLAFNHPEEYAEKLEHAHPAIAAYGGAFLLMLALEFFIDSRRKILWLQYIEKPLQRLSHLWAPALLSAGAVLIVAAVPANHHASTTIFAGLLGIASHIAISLFTNLFGSRQSNDKISGAKRLTGMAAFSAFIYLQILDASFSFDGVIGAFAITTDVILIGIGLGIGALWVRSLTVFMVKKGTLGNYIYLEHGAHYTVAVLAFILLISSFFEIPDVLAGVAGFGLIGSAILASRQALADRRRKA